MSIMNQPVVSELPMAGVHHVGSRQWQERNCISFMFQTDDLRQ